jgi:hypothetical protein
MGRKERSKYRTFEVSIEKACEDKELAQAVKELCLSKAEELKIYGYLGITYQQVWSCVTYKYIRGLPKIHKLVNDIISLNANKLMDWVMLGAYKQRCYRPRGELSG